VVSWPADPVPGRSYPLLGITRPAASTIEIGYVQFDAGVSTAAEEPMLLPVDDFTVLLEGAATTEVAGTRGSLVARQVSHIAPLVPQVAHFTAPSRLIYALFGAPVPTTTLDRTPPPPPDSGRVTVWRRLELEAAGPVSPLLTLADAGTTLELRFQRLGPGSDRSREGLGAMFVVVVAGELVLPGDGATLGVGDMAFVPRTVGTSLTSSGVSDLVILMWG
jgi:hypothetical protein